MNLYDGTGTLIPVGDSAGKIPWLNLSHKGKAPDAYGNSIYAFNRTQEYGMDGAELDLRLTSDNVVVCSHDSDITGKDSQGVTQTLTISSNTYATLSALTLFTIDNVDYHLVKFEDVARMAFYWGWKCLQLDVKSAGNLDACTIKASEIIRDYGLIGKAMYFSANANTIDDILANDPLAMFDIGSATVAGSIYEDIPTEKLWRSVHRANLPSYSKDGHPFYVYDAGASQADDIMSYQPNAIQWQADTDGASLSETFLANVDWE